MNRRRAKENGGLGVVLVIGGVAVVGYFIFNHFYKANQAAQLNAKCSSDRTLAQEALAATPDRQAAIRAQVESANGQKFLSDFEWQSWMKAQAIATCSATAGGLL